jgi:UDP-glucose 4-epimerase
MESMPRAIVTGGAGFIGSTIDSLINHGVAVLMIDDMSRGSEKNLEQAMSGDADLLEQDVRDGAALERAVRSFQPDTVFHLAAQIDVRKSMSSPAHDASVNVLGSIDVFSPAATTGVCRVVNTSTGGGIYSTSAPVPTPESAPTEPVSAYGRSKLTAENYASWFRQTYGLDVLTLRYGNVSGPRQPGGEAGVVAIFCDQIIAGRRLVIFGDGSQTRDFVYVGDVAQANLAVARAAEPIRRGYDVGTGSEVSVIELADAGARTADVEPWEASPEFAPPRHGEVQRSCLVVRNAIRDLELARPTPLVDGLRSTLDWVRAV